MAFFIKEIPEEYVSKIQGNYIFHDKNIFVHEDLSLPSDNEYSILNKKGFLKNSIFDEASLCTGSLINSENEEALTTAKNLNLKEIPVRQYFFETAEEAGSLAARLKTLATWINSTKFCCSCGSPLTTHKKENALFCPNCNTIHFPRIEPCIIVLIHKGEEVLLLRHSYRNQNLYTCLAGFMEAGESAEQAVYREVKEEVGIEIQNLRYAGSQGWPFPDQLMLAFHADYKKGQLKLQEEEILEARWLKIDEVENLPSPGSVAWKLMHEKF